MANLNFFTTSSSGSAFFPPAAIIIDRGDERKSSFRSKGGFDVNTFARKYFNGGGHFNAAGGFNREPLEEVVAKFKQAMKENMAELSSYQF